MGGGGGGPGGEVGGTRGSDSAPNTAAHEMVAGRYHDRIAPVLDHVRENPGADLGVEALARLVHFSPYHFHRVFTAVVGETVGVFVRRARLERAAQLMKAMPERDLGRVARAAGFGSASDFSRTFRRHYGMAPSAWDRRSPLVFRDAGHDPPDDDRSGLRSLVAADGGGPVEVRLERVPARTVAFHRIRAPFRPGALDGGYERLRRWLADRELAEPPGGLWGMSWDDVEVTPPDRIRYDLACPVPATTAAGAAGDGVQVRDLPDLRVAVAPARGGLPRVARVWDHLYHHWLPRSSYEPDLLPAFERYADWPDRLEGPEWRLDCCIPVVALRG